MNPVVGGEIVAWMQGDNFKSFFVQIFLLNVHAILF